MESQSVTWFTTSCAQQHSMCRKPSLPVIDARLMIDTAVLCPAWVACMDGWSELSDGITINMYMDGLTDADSSTPISGTCRRLLEHNMQCRTADN